MNHFLLSGVNDVIKFKPLDLDSGKYGIYAMKKLVETMIAYGADKKQLKAKAFGGAKLPNLIDHYDVGKNNIVFLTSYMEQHGIELVNASLGGSQGRVIHFSSLDYGVHMKWITKVNIELTPAIIKQQLSANDPQILI